MKNNDLDFHGHVYFHKINLDALSRFYPLVRDYEESNFKFTPNARSA